MNVHFLLKLVTNFLQERKEEVADNLVTYIDFSAVMSLSPYLYMCLFICLYNNYYSRDYGSVFA